MKKSEQQVINQQCIDALEELSKENNGEYLRDRDFKTRLYHCQAWLAETDSFLVLRSYDTIVAIFHKNTGIMYDVLRLVYGYTATSAQHISKFGRYCNEHYLVKEKLTYYAL